MAKIYRIIVFVVSLLLHFCVYAQSCNTDSIFHLGVDIFNGVNGKYMDREKGFNLQKEAAELGNADAQFELGYLYSNGIFVEQNDSISFYWYDKAASQGNVKAIDNCGLCYIEGKGVSLNHYKAVEYFERGATLNFAPSIFNLAVCYGLGNGVVQDLEKSFTLYRKAAELGDANSQYALALSFYVGRGIKKDLDQSYYWAKLALENGAHEAANLAGVLCVNVYPEKAFEYFKTGYEFGDIYALRNYAMCFQDGIGCEVDFVQSAAIYEEGMNKEDIESTYNLGLLLYEDKVTINVKGKPDEKLTKRKGLELIISCANKGFEEAINYCNSNKIKY